ncbi:MAG: hypothetical protein NC308_06300 [Clostridium sp.]|nr:hypothetical protein [Bacteroides sp.]MCM1198482.1 hypothetical protein [Clostridium sp.]
MDEYTFKHCPEGHYYQEDECPYCQSEMSFYEAGSNEDMHYLNVCSNGHAFQREIKFCPYCGEQKVKSVGRVLLTSALLGEFSIVLSSNIQIKVDGEVIGCIPELNIVLADHFYRWGYKVEGIPDIHHDSKIEIGNMSFTGKELIKMIDFLYGYVREIK